MEIMTFSLGIHLFLARYRIQSLAQLLLNEKVRGRVWRLSHMLSGPCGGKFDEKLFIVQEGLLCLIKLVV